MLMLRKLFVSRSPFKPSPAVMGVSYLLLAIWSLLVLFPLYWLFVTAFKLPIDVSTGPKYVMWVDFQPNLHAWEYVLDEAGDELVLQPFRSTIIAGFTSAMLALFIGSLASYALSRFTYRPRIGVVLSFIACMAGAIVAIFFGASWQIAVPAGIGLFVIVALTIGRRFGGELSNNDIAFWLISQRMLPPVAVIVPIYILFQHLNLLNTHFALIVTYTAVNLPLAIWFMRDYFDNIPIELEESAFIDGASRYQVLWRIVLPLSMPGLVATFLIVLIFAWNEYTMGLFLSGADTQTMPVQIVGQNATRGPQWWNMSVLVLLMITPVILLAIALERFIARGILIGAVKG
jgi:multiple sugar transport system permease protein